MSDNACLLLDNQLCFSLYSTSLAMTQLYKPLLEPIGITYPQYLILLILWETDGLSLKSVADRLGQKSGALTPVIKRMEEEGWVKRTRSMTDERLLEIRLTDKGRELKTKAQEISQCIASQCGLPMSSLIELKESLDELRKNLLKGSKP